MDDIQEDPLTVLNDAILGYREDSMLPAITEMLAQPKNLQIIAEKNNQLLRTALIMSDRITQQLLQIPAVTEKLKASAACESLINTLNTALLLDKNQLVCEVANKIWPNWWTKKDEYPEHIIKDNKSLHQTVRAKQMHSYMHHKHVANFLFSKVGEDVPSIILDFLGEDEMADQPITKASLTKIYKLKPKPTDI